VLLAQQQQLNSVFCRTSRRPHLNGKALIKRDFENMAQSLQYSFYAGSTRINYFFGYKNLARSRYMKSIARFPAIRSLLSACAWP
jgi:hypothetical protein